VKSRLKAHWGFVAVLVSGTALRALVMLGYRWQMWFPDSYGYLTAATHPVAGVIRPSGYPLLLWALRPLHSFALVTVLQHVIGLGTAVMVYALLRRNRLPGWAATLAAAPVLFDAYQVQLEHLVLSDTLFAGLVMGAVTVMLWRYDVTPRRSAAIGLLLGLAAVVRTVGLPLLAVFVLFLLARRVPWRALAAAVTACALPVAAYAGWFAADQHRFGLTGSTGVFLYSRTVAFADCGRMRPPAAERPLCPAQAPGRRKSSMVWGPTSPLRLLPGRRFDVYKDRLAGDFAARAMRAQPLDYLTVVGVDLARTFQLGHPAFPDAETYRYYLFRPHTITPPAQAARTIRAYGHASPVTRVVQPYAMVLRAYQRYVYLPGVLLGLIMIAGFAGIAARRRRFGGRASLPWGVAAALILIPPATVEFDYRYVLPAVSPACVAAALAVRDLWAARAAAGSGFRPNGGFGVGEKLDV
jgi:hypothetical protein